MLVAHHRRTLSIAWTRALRPDRPMAMWAACLVGVCPVFAPVVLWAPTPAAFVNDSLVALRRPRHPEFGARSRGEPRTRG
jgi:hypothetical protein